MKLETVKIKHENGFCIINKSDFEKSKHELFDEDKKQDDQSESKRGSRNRRFKKSDE